MILEPEAIFLQLLFETLNENAIQYAVMRNHETLPYGAGGSDLDILVYPKDESRVKSLLYEVIDVSGGCALGISETIGFFKVYAPGKTIAHENLEW
jgi:hypothetical protein